MKTCNDELTINVPVGHLTLPEFEKLNKHIKKIVGVEFELVLCKTKKNLSYKKKKVKK